MKNIPFWATVTSNGPSCYGTIVLSVGLLSVCKVGVSRQTVGWIKMSLGMEVGLGPGDIVVDLENLQLPHGKGHNSPLPNFRPTLLWNGRPSQQLLSSCSSMNAVHYKSSGGHYIFFLWFLLYGRRM